MESSQPTGEIDLTNTKWRFEERVNSLMQRKHFTRDEAEQVVKTVIMEKEQ